MPDLRYALRSLRRSPGYALAVISTLALGIGAVSMVQGVIDPLLFKPLQFEAPDRLVTLDSGMMPGEFRIIQTETTFLKQASLMNSGGSYGLSGDGEAERVVGAAVTPEFFTTLGVRPHLGVLPDAQPAGEVVVLSYELWQRRFGGDAGVLGEVIRVEGRSLTVTAVMQKGFRYPSRTELWLAAPLDDNNRTALWGAGGYRMVARLQDGASAMDVQQQIRGLSSAMSAANPFWKPAADYRAQTLVLPLHNALVGDVRRELLLLGGAVVLLLIMACANVANLVLVRGFGQAADIAVRSALGASGLRIARQMVSETLVLASLGGAVGIAFAALGMRTLRSILPPDLPRLHEIGLNARVLVACIAVTVGTGVLLGTIPALQSIRSKFHTALRSGARTSEDRSNRRLSRGLVVVQVAVAVLLVTSAGLLARSIAALQHTETGIGRMNAVTVRIDLPTAQYRTAQARNAFYDRLLPDLAALPGVDRVAVTSQQPFSQHLQLSAMWVENVTLDPNNLPIFVHRRVSEAFFAAAGVQLVSGRVFTSADAAAGGPPVAIVDETAAREFWPGQDPIGKRLGRPWMQEQRTVIGVVRSVLDGELAGRPERTMYIPIAHEPPHTAFIVVDGRSGMSVLPAVRATLHQIDPGVPLSNPATVAQLVRGTLAGQRLSFSVVGAFGAMALLLAVVGVYGVMSYTVGRRGREFAVRCALGARSVDVRSLVLREGMAITALGVGIGVAATLAFSRLLSSSLHGVRPQDPLTITAVIAIVLLAAGAALLIPATRASRVDLLTTLRE